MSPLLRNLLRRLAGVAAALIIAYAALTLALRLALPHADGLRNLVAERLGDYLGAEVTVGGLGLYLRGWQPELTLDQAVLRDPLSGERLLALDALRVDLNLRASLLALAPRIEGVTMLGARIEVQRSVDGRIGVRGLDQLNGGDGGAMTFFLREGRFSLADARIFWSDSFAGVPTLKFAVQRLDLVNTGASHRLSLRAAPPGDAAGELILAAELTGPPGQPQTWTGRAYADWRGSDLARVLRGRLPAALRLGTDALHLSSWLRLADGQVEQVTGSIWLDDLVLRRTDVDGAELDLGDVGASLRWQSNADGWQLDVPELKLYGSLLHADKTALRLRGLSVGEEHLILGRFAGIALERLADAARFAGPAPDEDALPEAVRQVLDGRIAGRLDTVNLQLQRPASADPEASLAKWLPQADWLINGRIRDLGIGPAPAPGPLSADAPPPAGPVPPVDGLNLSFTASPRAGALGITATDAYLDLRPHQAAPTRLTRLAGQLDARRLPAGGWALQTDALAIDTADVETLSRLLLRPADTGNGLFVDLHTHLRGGDVEAATRYLPVSKMDDRLEDWLARALVAGRLESGDLLLRGDLGRFPFRNGEGAFQLELRVRDGVLDYQPPKPTTAGENAVTGMRGVGAPPRTWPRLESIDATLRFDRQRFEVDVASAQILSTAVTSGSATMPNLWQPEFMAIAADGNGPLADGLAFLAETPLADKVGGIPRALAADGSGRLALTLDVPLRRGLKFGYGGELTFGDDAVVTITANDMNFTDVDGRLRFDNSGVSANGIKARLGEQPLQVDIATKPPAGDADGRTEVVATGSTGVDSLAKLLPSPWWALADGRLDWRLAATLDNANAVDAQPPLGLRLTSDLKGVGLDLPAPFGKAASASREFSLETRLVPDAPLDVVGRLGEIGAQVELTRGNAGLAPTRMAVNLNRLPEALPASRGLALSGRIGTLDLGDWLAWRSRHEALFRKPDAAPDASPLPILPVRLELGEFRFGPLRFSDVRGVLAPAPGGGWRIGAEATDNSASLTLPAQASDALQVRLDNLDIAPLLAAEGPAKQPAKPAEEPNPHRVPPLSLQIEALRRGSKELGRLRLDLARMDSGLRMSEFSLTGPLVSASGTGTWSRDATGFTQTILDLDLRSDDLGEFLRNAGYYSALSGAPSDGTLQLTWPAGPGGFSLARARGTLTAEIDAGRMLEVEPGVGRMLGILNLGAIERRLSLDFSDVTDTGFGFDSIKGRLTIGNGQARIGQLQILSSTADISIRGSTNLVDETFDQTLRVTPKIGTGVALASALAGGPLVGAAVLLADKVSGDTVNRLAAYEYRVTGPWSAPQISRIAGNSGSVPSVPDLLAPGPAEGREASARSGADTGETGGVGRDGSAARSGGSTPPRPVSPFLENN